jgi:LysR family transcriptional regulator of abg operon
MKIHQLQALVAVVDAGGIRAASRWLCLSQAAVTKALRQLEEECGSALLVRRSRGVDLTPDGERLLLRARLVVRQLELAREELQQARGSDEGLIRVAITPYATITVLGQVFAWFRQRYKQVQVHVIDGLISRSLPRLRDGTLDLALVAADAGETSSQEFACTHVCRVPQRIAAREGHPVFQDLTAGALVQYEWLHTAPILDVASNRQAAMFRAAGVELPRNIVTCETLPALALLRNGNALGIVPEPLLSHPEARGIVPVPTRQLFPCELDVMLLSRPDVPLSPAAEHFAQCLLQALRAESPQAGIGVGRG